MGSIIVLRPSGKSSQTTWNEENVYATAPKIAALVLISQFRRSRKVKKATVKSRRADERVNA
jgi:hypothetical protein